MNKILREAGENRVSVHLFTSGSAPALRAIKALSGKQRPQPLSCILSDGNPLKPLVCIADYYEELLEIDPLIRAAIGHPVLNWLSAVNFTDQAYRSKG